MEISIPSLKWAHTPNKLTDIDNLIIHHSTLQSASVEDLHRLHIRNGMAGISYHYYVRKNGVIYRARPENWMGEHARGYNGNSIGICFEGNFDTETMREEQMLSGAELLRDLKWRYPVICILPHRAVSDTPCPGENFPLDEMTYYMENEMDTESFSAMMDDYLLNLSLSESDGWSGSTRVWAEKNHLLISDGKGRKAFQRFLTPGELLALATRENTAEGELVRELHKKTVQP